MWKNIKQTEVFSQHPGKMFPGKYNACSVQKPGETLIAQKKHILPIYKHEQAYILPVAKWANNHACGGTRG